MSQPVPTVPTVPEGGNTISPSSTRNNRTCIVNPAKKWCFTLCNYTPEDVEYLKSSNVPLCQKIMFQSEIGEEGTPHLQGWVEFKTKKRPIIIVF